MRDDTITISGPFEVLDLDVPEYIDEETGELVAAHTLDMSDMRRFTFETRACSCGRLHGYSVEFCWSMIFGYPELAEHLLDTGILALKRSVQNCQDIEAIARWMGR